MSPTSPRSKLLRVLVCGGGNAAHVFAGSLAARGHLPTLLTTYPKEADAIRKGCEANAGMEIRGWTTRGASAQTIRGKPVAIVGSFERSASRPAQRRVRVRPDATWCNTDRPRGGPRRAASSARPDTRTGTSFALEFLSHRSCGLPHDDLTICRPAVSSHPPQVLLAMPAPYPTRTWYSSRRTCASPQADASHASHALADTPRVCPPSSPPPWRKGFDMAAGAALADAGEFAGEVLWRVRALPWACRVARPGAVRRCWARDAVGRGPSVPGASENLDVYAKPVLQTLQIAVGPVPKCASPPVSSGSRS